MGRVVDHQTRFMAQLMGGPSSYDDEALRRLHARLPIDDAAFDDMTDLLRETLEDLELDPSDAGAVVREIELRRPLIVNPRSRGARPPSPPRRHEPRTPVRGVARVVGVGLAIVSPADLGIGYRNARFEEWFGLEGEDGARARRPGAERGRRGAARAHGAGAPLPLRQRGRRRAERAERLLLNIMPRKVYEEIRTFGVTTPQRFDEASTLMVDFVGIGRRRVYSLLAEASLPVAAAI